MNRSLIQGISTNCPGLDPASIPQAAAQLDRYVQELARYAPKLNLVSLADLPRLQTHHILPALFMGRQIALHPNRRILDVGSGGGLPALPLAITHPMSEFTLVEARRRRANFLRHCARMLELTNVRVLNARVEDLTIPPQDIVFSRAVGGMTQLRAAAASHLQPHGLYITTQSPKAQHPVADHTLRSSPGDTPTTIAALHAASCG